jgi:hypothetical protein
VVQPPTPTSSKLILPIGEERKNNLLKQYLKTEPNEQQDNPTIGDKNANLLSSLKTVKGDLSNESNQNSQNNHNLKSAASSLFNP